MLTKTLTEYLCPNCETWSNSAAWEETERGCADCGSHDALRCPACEESVDMIMRDLDERTRSVPDYQIGDHLVFQQPDRDAVERVLLAIRPTGYTWTYPRYMPVEPDDLANTWISENSTDPYLEWWERKDVTDCPLNEAACT